MDCKSALSGRRVTRSKLRNSNFSIFNATMKRALIIILIIGFYSCSEKRKSQDKNPQKKIEKSNFQINHFRLIQDFEKHKATFTADTLHFFDHSTEGGELKVFLNATSDYIVLDFWLLGEMGKLNYTYWADKDFNFKTVKKLDYQYDKPFYMSGFKTDSTIYYLSYLDSENKLFDINRLEIKNEKIIDSIRIELESFFKDVTKGMGIIK